MSPGFTMIDNDAVIARLPEIGGTVVMVYLVLAWHANQEGVAWPSQETIAKETGLQPRTVRKALHRLRAFGLVEAEPHSGHATAYRITPAPTCRPDNGGPAPECLTPGTDVPGGRHVHAADPGTYMPKNNTKEQHQRTTPKNKTRRNAAEVVAVPVEIDTPEFQAAWADWLQHRREKRNSMTPTAQRAALNELVEMGVQRAIAAVRYSIKKGWTGVFEKKEYQGGNGKPSYGDGAGSRYDAGRKIASIA